MIWLISILLTFHLSNGEFLGKFVLHSQNEVVHPGNSFDILHKPDEMLLAPSPGPVPSNEIGSILALSLGLSIPNDIEWAGLQVTNPFKMPKALLMFSIDNLPNGHRLKYASSASFPIKSVDGSESLNSMLNIAPKYSLSHHLGAIMEDKSKILTVASDLSIAENMHSQGPLAETSIWNEATKSWKLVHGGDGSIKTNLHQEDIFQRIPKVLTSGFLFNSNERTVKCKVEGLEFSFNLDEKADFLLFSELVYILSQYEGVLREKALVRDNAPDMFMFSLSALKGIEKKYGVNSPQVKGAIILIEKLVEKVTRGFVQLYDGNILAISISLVDERDPNFSADEIQPFIKQVLADSNAQDIHFSILDSEIHLTNDIEMDARRRLCEAIQGSLPQSSGSIKFKCMPKQTDHHTIHRRSLLQDNSVQNDIDEADLNLASKYDDMFPVIFNMWFWLLVLLILIVYAFSIAMWNMDPGRDSIIYRLTQQKIKSD